MSEKKMFLLEDFCKVKQPFLKFQSVREFLERDEKWVSIFRNSFKESFVFLNALLTSDQEEAHKLIDGGIFVVIRLLIELLSVKAKREKIKFSSWLRDDLSQQIRELKELEYEIILKQIPVEIRSLFRDLMNSNGLHSESMALHVIFLCLVKIDWVKVSGVVGEKEDPDIEFDLRSPCQNEHLVGGDIEFALGQLKGTLKNVKLMKSHSLPENLRWIFVGPVGTGKTELAEACFWIMKKKYIFINASEFSSYDAAQKLRKVFDVAEKYEYGILIDEGDSILAKRSSGLGALQAQFNDSVQRTPATVIITTNSTADMDASCVRPERIDSIFQLSLPDEKSRRAILKKYCEEFVINISFLPKNYLSVTNGFSGAELKSLIKTTIRALIINKGKISKEEFKEEFMNSVVSLARRDDNLDCIIKKVPRTEEIGGQKIGFYFR